MSDVAIFFFAPWLGGGATTFTAHLFRGLALAGAKPMIYRVADRPAPGALPFGGYEGVTYANVSMAQARAVVKTQPSVMSAPAGHPHVRHGVIEALLALGMRAVVHDDGEAVSRDWRALKPPICVRQALTVLVPGSMYLPHPYVRAAHVVKRRRPLGGAVSLARVAAAKRTNVLLDANRALPAAARVRLAGMEDVGYAKTLAATYADVYAPRAAGRRFPPTFDAAVGIAAGARFHADMSYAAADGGGTQYAQLEAMDAGCVNVMHADWFRFEGDMKAGVHAVAAADAAGLAAALMAAPDLGMVQAGYELLKAHDARAVGSLYVNELTKGN